MQDDQDQEHGETVEQKQPDDIANGVAVGACATAIGEGIAGDKGGCDQCIDQRGAFETVATSSRECHAQDTEDQQAMPA